jgi:phosphoribosyl 1,2-cyclic phosphodiesterase
MGAFAPIAPRVAARVPMERALVACALLTAAGTGIRALGMQLDREGVSEVHLLLSHLHMDHLQGLGFFRPLFRADCDVHIWGPSSPTQSLRDRIAMYLSPPLFPVSVHQLPSRVHFHDAPERPWRVGCGLVAAASVAHQGPTLGYRIESGGSSLAYIPDHEPAIGIDLRSLEPEWVSGHDIAFGVDVLLHDSQYSEEEYPHHVGWGHSSIEHVVTFAELARARRLVMFHHDPLHSDDALEELRRRACELNGGSVRIDLAYEGMELAIHADAAVDADAEVS